MTKDLFIYDMERSRATCTLEKPKSLSNADAQGKSTPDADILAPSQPAELATSSTAI